MSSTNVSLREDVYRALRDAKADDESFSDVVERLLAAEEGRHPLHRLVGTLDEAEVRRRREATAGFRESVDTDMESSS